MTHNDETPESQQKYSRPILRKMNLTLAGYKEKISRGEPIGEPEGEKPSDSLPQVENNLTGETSSLL